MAVTTISRPLFSFTGPRVMIWHFLRLRADHHGHRRLIAQDQAAHGRARHKRVAIFAHRRSGVNPTRIGSACTRRPFAVIVTSLPLP
jgi:hypothetical protein